ncbi:MAG TPA: hypothetical protein VKE22_20335 [Haliangiales bacterium]|nr:hypothetical protein [Haliangiales bacterium]
MTRRLLLACALVAVASCDDGRRDEAVLIALSQVRALHHQADVLLAAGDADTAIAAVARALEVPFPPGAPEAEDVRLDARARLGKLYLGRGRPADARRIADEGIAAARRESFFLANLLQVSAEVHEAEARRAADPAAARREHEAAILEYERSVHIAERIQQRLVKEGR